MLVSVVRMLVLWGAVAVAGFYAWENRAQLTTMAQSAPARPAASAVPAAKPAQVANASSFKADRSGHIYLEAAANGAPVRFMVDTGASFVTLRPEDARAAGIFSGDLHFTMKSATANGEVRIAPIRLRELRLGQLVMEDVDAVVVDSPLTVSLLGMSFLKRLDGYEMRDGAMVISW
jgi:aspartyl protease family protein